MNKEIFLKIKFLFIPCVENKYRPYFLDSDFLFYSIIFLLILKILFIPFFLYFYKTSLFADITKNGLINLANNERESLGLVSLKESVKLDEAAYLKAKDMLEKDYFSHISSDGISPWHWFKEAGYDYKVAGENLAIGFVDSEEVHQAWLDSVSHKNNIINPAYKEIGIAVLKGDFQGNEVSVVVQLLGAPKIILSPIKEVQAAEEKPLLVENQPPEKAEEALNENREESPNREVFVSEPLEIPASLGEEKEENNIGLTVSKFIYFNYSDLIEKIVLVLMIFTIVSFLLNIFIEFNIQHKDLIVRSIIFIVLLSLSFLINKEFTIQLIPHNLIILGLTRLVSES